MSAFELRFGARAGAAVIGAFALLSLATGPARAQFLGYFGWPQAQSPGVAPGSLVERRLAARGLLLMGPLQRNGGVYLADVRDRRGNRRRLVIDAYSGSILQIFAYGPPRPPAPIPGGAAPYPAYAYRYAAPAPGEGGGFTVAPVPAPDRGVTTRPRVEKRPARKLARREVAPAEPRAKKPETAPSEATREPSVSAPAASSGAAGSKPTAKPEREEARVSAGSASTSAGAAKPSPVKKKAPAPAPNGPGYANGVPINPLD